MGIFEKLYYQYNDVMVQTLNNIQIPNNLTTILVYLHTKQFIQKAPNWIGEVKEINMYRLG